MGALTATEREAHAVLLRRLDALREETRGLPHGYAIRYSAAALPDIVAWVALERRCCPFLGFALELAPRAGALWHRLTGAEGVKAFMAAALGLAPPRAR